LRLGLFVSLLFLITFSVDAQTLKGIVVDAETAKPLYPVTVVNLTTEQSTSTSESGYYELSAKNGDGISFSFLGYHTEQRIANPWAELRVELLPLTVQLKEYILHPDYTPFQKDSAAMATLYSTELNKKAIKPGFSTANGGGFTGLIGGPVQKISKSYRQNKKFKENFKRDIEQKYIDTKYTRGLVAALTGFGGDTLAIFMNTYIMEYPFARAASDLEIKMWIRNNYKEYLKPKTSKVLAPGSIRNK
jgi:hypothetical protein